MHMCEDYGLLTTDSDSSGPSGSCKLSVGGTMEFARMENGFYEKLVQSACRKGPAVSSLRWKGPALSSAGKEGPAVPSFRTGRRSLMEPVSYGGPIMVVV